MKLFSRNTKIGDVFGVDLENGKVKYFQLIAFDLTQLNSDVIRSFKEEYQIDGILNLETVVDGEVEFYAHCVTKFGVKMKLWTKVGNIQRVGDVKMVTFRDTNDYSDPKIAISSNWYVWKINDKDFTFVGKLTGGNRNSKIGIVVNPFDIVNRIKTGKYNFLYPGFE